MFSPRFARVKHFARVVNPAALSAIAELFLMNGDMCAWLYTGSPAMHSEKITLFEPESSRLKKAGAGSYSNSFIAIKRWGSYRGECSRPAMVLAGGGWAGVRQRRLYFAGSSGSCNTSGAQHHFLYRVGTCEPSHHPEG